MSPRGRGRTQPCGVLEARAKLQRAEKFLEAAQFITDEPEPDADFVSAAAALSVLAGISASDAACCKALGRRSRGDDHHDAEKLLEEIARGGKSAANALRRLLNLKDEAHYGFYNVGSNDLERAVRQARTVIDLARDVLSR